MTKLCPKCHFIGKGKFGNYFYENFFASAFVGVVLIILGFVNLFRFYPIALVKTGLGIFLYIIMNLVLLVPFIIGIFNLINYFRGGEICSKCNHKPMLKIDTPEAIKIIKEHDLEIPK